MTTSDQTAEQMRDANTMAEARAAGREHLHQVPIVADTLKAAEQDRQARQGR